MIIIFASAHIFTQAEPTRTTQENKKPSIYELSLNIFSIADHYLGLPQGEIPRIYENCFKSENL